MKIATVLGTRPEIIKLSPLLPLLDREFQQLLIHTGQHYSWEMDRQFLDELQLRNPDYNLDVRSGNHGEQTGKMIMELEKIFLREKPSHIIVFGDTNSTLAGAIAAAKIPAVLFHLEAGARSHNLKQPEEINRTIADHCADFLFTIDGESTENLLREGFSRENIFEVGNIIEESCERILQLTPPPSAVSLFSTLQLQPEAYVVATIHRAENTDNPEELRKIITAFNHLAEKIPLVFPVHPRTKNVLQQQNIVLSPAIKALEPLGYSAFVQLLSKARFVLTDSGGVFEEALFLNVPVLITRDALELNESVQTGKTVLVGTTPVKIVKAAERLMESEEEIQRLKAIPFPRRKNISKEVVKIIKGLS